MGLAVGLRATVRHVVTEADTAIQAACGAALESHLGAGMTSVGTGVALEHRRASPVGTEIEVEAELTELAGHRLVFSFIARHVRPGADGGPGPGAGGGPGENGDLVAGAGTVVRIVVDRDQFLARAAAPAG